MFVVTVHELVRRLPAPAVLRERCRAFAVLDAVFARRFRSYTFVAGWRSGGTSLAGHETVTGDRYAVVFAPAGAFLFGFDHESPVSPWRDEPRAHWPGLLDGLPAALREFTLEPSFLCEGFFDATVCAWFEAGDDRWRCGPVDFTDPRCGGHGDPDGSSFLFDLVLAGSARAYTAHVARFHRRETDGAAVASVLAGHPLSPGIVTSLHPGVDFHAVAAEAAATEYPIARP